MTNRTAATTTPSPIAANDTWTQAETFLQYVVRLAAFDVDRPRFDATLEEDIEGC